MALLFTAQTSVFSSKTPNSFHFSSSKSTHQSSLPSFLSNPNRAIKHPSFVPRSSLPDPFNLDPNKVGSIPGEIFDDVTNELGKLTNRKSSAESKRQGDSDSSRDEDEEQEDDSSRAKSAKDPTKARTKADSDPQRNEDRRQKKDASKGNGRSKITSIPGKIVDAVTDEWGELTDRNSLLEPTRQADSDPTRDEDEWQEEDPSGGKDKNKVTARADSNPPRGQDERQGKDANRGNGPSKQTKQADSDSPGDKDKQRKKDASRGKDMTKRNNLPGEIIGAVTDELGELTDPESLKDPTRLLDSDPPINEDEWQEDYASRGNGNAGKAAEKQEEDGLGNLKRCLVDSVYGTELGFRADSDVRAEVLELVNQLEAANPNPNPVEATELLDGNWVLLYTAFSELLPLLAAGGTPLLKVEKISQKIDTSRKSIVNATTLSSPFATFSFSATASFEVRSPSRIQVQFREGTLEPPEIKPRIDLPESVNIFGQKINFSPLQQSLSPLQEVVSSISRAISGQPPLKLPIPGERTKSWLLTTYLDEDFRISRGDGGLFVLVREGSPLLDQW